MSQYPHLNLQRWPFNVVPDEGTAANWVGRQELLRQVKRLVRGASRIPATQLVLMWADYGAGKTHTLRHLELLARQADDLTPIYVVTPKGIKSFLDFYRAVVEGVTRGDSLAAAGEHAFRGDASLAGTDVGTALIRIASATDGQADVARAWLRADKVPLSDLRAIGISKRVETVADGINALDQLITALKLGGQRRVVLLIDEVQELEELNANRHAECVGGLHKIFDRHTDGLTLLLSFTTATQSAVRSIIGDALFDRAGERLALPLLDEDAACDLVAGLVSVASIDPEKAPYPFTVDAIEEGVAELARHHGTLSPRTVIRSFDAVLREAEFDIDEGALTVCDAEYVRDRLGEADLVEE